MGGWLDLRAWICPTGLPLETAGGNWPLVKGNLGVRLTGRAEWPRLELKAQESLGARSRAGLVQTLQVLGCNRGTDGKPGCRVGRGHVNGSGVLNPTSSLPAGLKTFPLAAGLRQAVGVGASHRRPRCPPTPSSQPAAPTLELGTFCRKIHGKAIRGLLLFCLRIEVAVRFMGAINPHPISALTEAICIVTKIIRDNCIGRLKKNNYVPYI